MSVSDFSGINVEDLPFDFRSDGVIELDDAENRALLEHRVDFVDALATGLDIDPKRDELADVGFMEFAAVAAERAVEFGLEVTDYVDVRPPMFTG